jgi:N-methylhydantoinase B
MEGLQLDQIKLYEGGEPDRKALRFISDNIRYPESSMGDLRSQVAACTLAERRVVELLQRYGRQTIEASIETIFAESEAKCRAIVAQIKDGEYEAEAILDHDFADFETPVPLKVRVVVQGDDMTIDLTQSSPQVRGAINSRTLAAPYIAYKAITTPIEPVNEGSFAGCKVEIQEGNLMMARFPATMAGWSLPLPTVVDTILTALAPALPERIPAAHMGTLGGAIVFFGNQPKSGKGFVLQSIEGGGWGGRPWEDGQSGSVSVCQGDVRNSPVENIELKVPVIIESRGLRPGSAGAGKFRGGFGMATRVRNLVEGRWNLPGPHGRGKMPPWGVWGGKSGAPGDSMLKLPEEPEFQHKVAQRLLVPADSRAIIMTAGGGGWGNPLERDPQLVRTDVMDGLVSIEAARDDYGVALDPNTLAIDADATAKLRSYSPSL